MTRDKKGSIFEEIQSHRFKPGCGLQPIIQRLDEGQLDQLNAALKNDALFHSVIAEGLKRWGYHTSADMVSRHRKGLCSCAKQN